MGRIWWIVTGCLLSALLIVLDGVRDIARAETVPLRIISACRATKSWGLFDLPNEKGIPASSKGTAFLRPAVLHAMAGDFERAFEQFDHAIILDPNNAVFYLGRGIARLENRQQDQPSRI
jgi:hypothetical protein